MCPSCARPCRSRSGEEFFNRYWERFKVGARSRALTRTEARRIWDKMCTFGSWAFNKSHSVSYGLISYWCCVLKAHYPLQFAAACLRNGRILVKNLRDMNEYQSVVKRGGRLIKRNNLFLILTVEDDTGNISCRVARERYAKWGLPLVDGAKEGEWFLWKGYIRGDWRQVNITQWRKLPQ
jgi:hypothetical protein